MDNEDRTGLFKSVMEFHYGLRNTADYDVQVLATAVNQYLHQIFEQLDFANSGTIWRQDFASFLRAAKLGDLANQLNETRRQASAKLTFRAFHEAIGRYYAALAGADYVAFDCRNTEKDYKESLKLLWTIGRPTLARECDCHSQSSLSLNPFTSTPTSENRSFQQVTPLVSLRQKECIVCSRCRDGSVPDLNATHDSDELENLREVVEDLRSALQHSDAQSMALHVLVEKARVSADVGGGDQTTDDVTLRATSSPSSAASSDDADDDRRQRSVGCVRELQLELEATKKRLHSTSQQNKALVAYTEKMAETFERTKSAIATSLHRVRHLESQAKEGLILETKILELQRELQNT